MEHPGHLGQHTGVERVGLGQLAGRAGEVPGLPRVDAGDPQAGLSAGFGDGGLVAAGGFDHNPHVGKLAQHPQQATDAGCRVRKLLEYRLAIHGYVQRGFADVEPDSRHD